MYQAWALWWHHLIEELDLTIVGKLGLTLMVVIIYIQTFSTKANMRATSVTHRPKESMLQTLKNLDQDQLSFLILPKTPLCF